ncbi:MAG: metal ABC transporter permease [Rhizobiales bacterium]|nr:metal ABC transporter permease [Hyphomicrobiales bacterium]
MIYDLLIAPFTQFDFMRRALVAMIVLAFGVAPAGVFLMLRRMSLMGDAMSHAILPGVAVAFLISGVNRIAMSIGGLIAGVLVALLSGLVTRVTPAKEDASLAAFYLMSLALGVAIVSSHGTNLDLLEILFGNVRALDALVLTIVAVNTTVSLFVFAIIYRPLVIECVDPLFLKTMGRAGAVAHLAFLALVVINLISAFLALGTLLAVGLMILPAAIAKFWSRDLTRMILIAVASAILSGYIGLVVTARSDIPAGPAVILVAGLFYFLSLLLGSEGGILRRLLPGRHLEA